MKMVILLEVCLPEMRDLEDNKEIEEDESKEMVCLEVCKNGLK
jgi:hypothetical protein